MAVLYHLTPEGWNEDPVGRGKALETWAVTVETYANGMLTRWACVARYRHLEMEERRALHRRFGSPPVMMDRTETEEGVAVDSSIAVRV